MNKEFLKSDIDENKYKAGLGYFIFFLPLVLCKDSKLGRHCANQGLILLIVSGLLSALLGIFTVIPLIGWIFEIVAGLVRFVLLVVALLCFLQLTTNDRAPEIPYVGGFRIID